MRVGGRGLSILITILALAFPSTAAAKEDGGFAVRDGVVDVEATSRVPGADGGGAAGAPSPCEWRVVIADDQARGVFGPDGERLFSDTGRWLQRVCNGQVEAVGGLFVVPEGGAFAVADLLEQARNALDPPVPSWGASPNGTSVPMVTQMPTWLWVERSYWDGGFVARASTPSGRVWAEARAEPVDAVWQVGREAAATCGAGTVWQPGQRTGQSDCSFTFRHSSAGTAGVPLSVTVRFTVEGVTSLGGSVALGEVTRTSAPVLVQVTEIQAIETNGR